MRKGRQQGRHTEDEVRLVDGVRAGVRRVHVCVGMCVRVWVRVRKRQREFARDRRRPSPADEPPSGCRESGRRLRVEEGKLGKVREWGVRRKWGRGAARRHIRRHVATLQHQSMLGQRRIRAV